MHDRIYESICEVIGSMPIVRLKRIPGARPGGRQPVDITLRLQHSADLPLDRPFSKFLSFSCRTRSCKIPENPAVPPANVDVKQILYGLKYCNLRRHRFGIPHSRCRQLAATFETLKTHKEHICILCPLWFLYQLRCSYGSRNRSSPYSWLYPAHEPETSTSFLGSDR